MRKSNIMFLCDTIFWYLIYFLPVIMYGIYLIHGSESGDSLMDFSTFISTNLKIAIYGGNPIYSTLVAIFGPTGVVPMFSSGQGYIFIIISYFATMVIIHLCVDFLLFIPRLAHKWMDMYTKGVEK